MKAVLASEAGLVEEIDFDLRRFEKDEGEKKKRAKVFEKKQCCVLQCWDSRNDTGRLLPWPWRWNTPDGLSSKRAVLFAEPVTTRQG